MTCQQLMTWQQLTAPRGRCLTGDLGSHLCLTGHLSRGRTLQDLVASETAARGGDLGATMSGEPWGAPLSSGNGFRLQANGTSSTVFRDHGLGNGALPVEGQQQQGAFGGHQLLSLGNNGGYDWHSQLGLLRTSSALGVRYTTPFGWATPLDCPGLSVCCRGQPAKTC